MRNETYFERMERAKKEFLNFHENCKLSIDSILMNPDGSVN